MSKRTSGSSATGKPTAFTPKKGTTQRAIESEHTEGRAPVKAGRNMGGRGADGQRVRGPQGHAGR